MGEFIKQHESDYGLSLILLSNSDLDKFPQNSPSAFENVFKVPVQLNDNKNYDLVLANLHCPSYQNTLVKNDSASSFIQYNLGLFNYNHVKKDYVLDKNSVTPLWKLVPNDSLVGIGFEKELSDYNNNNNNNNVRISDNFKAREAHKTRHLKFIEKLNSCLMLDKTMDINSQRACLSKYKDTLKHFNIGGPSGGLMANYSYGQNRLEFPNLNKVPHFDRYKLINSFINVKRQVDGIKDKGKIYDVETVMHFNNRLFKTNDPNIRRDSTFIKKHVDKVLNRFPFFKTGQGNSNKRNRDESNRDAYAPSVSDISNTRNTREVNDKEDPLDENTNDLDDEIMSSGNKTKEKNEETEVFLNDDPRFDLTHRFSLAPSNSLAAPPTTANFEDISKPIIGFYISFGNRMKYFLNLEDEMILIGYAGFAVGDPLKFNQKITPNFSKKLIKTLFVYSNLVASNIRVGDHMTNLLDIVTFGKNIHNKSSSLHVYKPLANKYFSAAAVAITDENGVLISFPNELYTALEIVVRVNDN